MHRGENGVVGPGRVVFAIRNEKTKSTIQSVENPAISRKPEKDVRVFCDWSSVVQTRDTQRARNLVQREEQRLVGENCPAVYPRGVERKLSGVS